MKKRILSLILALALCLGLSISANAVSSYEIIDGIPVGAVDIDGTPVYSGESGDGWDLKYNEESSTFILTLNNFKCDVIEVNRSVKIILASGSKNSISHMVMTYNPLTIYPELNDSGIVTFAGTGELSIDGSQWTLRTFSDISPFYGRFGELKFEDGLSMTGGETEGDAKPLILGPEKAYDEVLGKSRMVTTQDGQSVGYIRIAPSSGNATTNVTTSSPSTTSTNFTDVPATSPFAEAINWAVEQKITNGITATTFGSSNTCTISHILTFLARSIGVPDEGREKEVVKSWAGSLGLIGYKTDLDTPCTRSAAVTYMWKVAGSPTPSKSASFSDVPADADYAQAVSWAVEQGITSGTSATTFSPDNTCTRGQIVTFLYRASK